MHNFQGHPGVAFIAGKTFDTEYGTHEAGSIVKEAPQFPNLDVLVDMRWLFPFSPEEGYEYLPPHLFTGTHLKEEIEALLAGDQSINSEQFPDADKPDVIVQAEREAEIQQEMYPQMLREAGLNQRRIIENAEADNDRSTSKPVAAKPAAPTKKESK